MIYFQKARFGGRSPQRKPIFRGKIIIRNIKNQALNEIP